MKLMKKKLALKNWIPEACDNSDGMKGSNQANVRPT